MNWIKAFEGGNAGQVQSYLYGVGQCSDDVLDIILNTQRSMVLELCRNSFDYGLDVGGSRVQDECRQQSIIIWEAQP